MTTRHILFLILLFLGQNQALSQKEEHHRCGTVSQNELLRAQFPSLSTTAEFEKWMAQRIQKLKTLKQKQTSATKKKYGTETYTIPIIFHIIHDGESIGATPNIDALYIDAQIEQLNLDFANLSGSTYSVAADTEIQFCAAKIDPTGNCLTEPGINRLNRNDLGINPPPYTYSYFDTSVKTISQWNPNDYLNVWVGDLTGPGAAQLPEATYLQGIHNNNGVAITDGLSIRYSTIGSVTVPFPVSSALNKGRTMTHEMGHFLGLHHIWGEFDFSCSQDDFCADTPQQFTQSAGCAVGNDSCPFLPGLDMVENYMDYSNDDCMNTFTADQRDRMLVVMDPILGSIRRASLNDSPACDCAPVAAFSPEGNITVCTITNTIQFLNESIRTNSSTTYAWTFSGAGVTPTSSILENPIVSVTSSGNVTVSLTVTTANGTDSTGPAIVAVNTVSTAPSSPTLTAPANSAFQISVSPTLSWTAVTDADNYLVEIATDATMNTIVKSDITNSNSITFFGLNPLTDYYWRVIPINDCNASNISSGNSSAIWSFQTLDFSCSMYSATDTPKSISISGKPVVTSTLTVPSGVGTIASLKISKLSIEHSYMEDLSISLTSPSGLTVLLIEEICGSSDDLNLVFEDAGSPNSTIPCPATNGLAYQALAPFSILNGTDPAGDWVLTVSDAASGDGGQIVCWDLEICTEFVLVCPGTLAVSASSTNVNCAGQSTGTVTASPTGGIPVYSYVWQNSSGQSVGTNASIIGLPADNYTVFLTDGYGCVVQGNAVVTEPSQALSLLLDSQTNVSCNGLSDGELDVQISGGTMPYTISWSNGGTTDNIQNLVEGTYSLTVTDDNNCSVSDSWTITEPDVLTGSVTADTEVTCFGDVNGSATVVSNGGTGPYSYIWSSGETGSTALNLPVGPNSVTITDDHNCQSINSVNINGPSALVISVDQSINPSCPNNADGSITVSGTGGTGSIVFAWSDGQMNPSAVNLSEGTYTVTATDDNNCVAIESVQISDPIINITVVTNAPSCPGYNDGSASVTITGGLAPYIYLWSSGETQNSISNKIPGTYSVSIQDDNGCQFTEIVTIPAASLSVINTAYDLTCQNNSNGALWAQATGGSAPYMYEWTDSNGTVVGSTGLPAGIYTLTVIDNIGCMITSTATINPAANEYTNSNNNKLTGVQPISFDYEVDGKIESNQTIDSNGNPVDYDSGMSIELEEGFEVKSGSLFHAFIDGCGGSM